MSDVRLAEELGNTAMLLQDVYGTVRRKEQELEGLKDAHAEEVKALGLEVEALKTQLLLMQMLVHGVLPKAETKVPDDEYTV